tara:strand:+ start:47 stop:352 length:306 start_codon:yes stop_codon:yes gene_type:complete
MKLGLVRIENDKLLGVQYYESKWERELGDVLNIDGIKWKVGMIGESRNEIIIELNKITKKYNSIIRKKNQLNKLKERIIMSKVYKDLNLRKYQIGIEDLKN